MVDCGCTMARRMSCPGPASTLTWRHLFEAGQRPVRCIQPQPPISNHGSAHRPREFQRRILRCRTATGPGMGGRRRSLIHSGQPSLPRGVGRPGLVSKDLAPGTYRVRYAARGMDSARAVDTIVETEEPIDTYQLSFWPAKGDAPDRVVRQESQTATYWNGWANSLHPTS